MKKTIIRLIIITLLLIVIVIPSEVISNASTASTSSRYVGAQDENLFWRLVLIFNDEVLMDTTDIDGHMMQIDNSMIPDEYTLVEWNTEPDGSGYSFGMGEDYIFNDDRTLYAIVEKKPEIILGETVKISNDTFVYTGDILRPDIISAGNTELKEGEDYTVSWSNIDSSMPGEYSLTITGTEKCIGSATAYYRIEKAENTLKAIGKTIKLKQRTLRKKSLSIKNTKAIRITAHEGKVTYRKVSGNKKITINKKTGKITVKKKLKKGTYKVRIKITAAGNDCYKAGSRTVTVKIKVK